MNLPVGAFSFCNYISKSEIFCLLLKRYHPIYPAASFILHKRSAAFHPQIHPPQSQNLPAVRLPESVWQPESLRASADTSLTAEHHIWVIAVFRDELPSSVCQLQLQFPVSQPPIQILHAQFHYAADIFPRQGLKRMISSRRFKNSGLKCARRSFITALSASGRILPVSSMPLTDTENRYWRSE